VDGDIEASKIVMVFKVQRLLFDHGFLRRSELRWIFELEPADVSAVATIIVDRRRSSVEISYSNNYQSSDQKQPQQERWVHAFIPSIFPLWHCLLPKYYYIVIVKISFFFTL
jgi:hypothetical protein